MLEQKLKRVYAFEFSDKSVYVGLSCDIRSRILSHISRSSKSPVKFHINSTFGLKYEVKILSDPISPEEGGELERFYINQYKERGFKLLNSTKGGELGGNKIKWPKELVKKIALNFDSIGSFYQKEPKAYSAAQRNGWLGEVCAHMRHNIQFTNILTKDVCQNEANNFRFEHEFERLSPLCYAAAKRHGWLKEICSHMIIEDGQNISSTSTTLKHFQIVIV